MDPRDIDHEHEILFGLLDTFRTCPDMAFADVEVDRLLRFASDHFTNEESLMGGLPIQDREAHCREHQSLTSKLIEIKLANLRQAPLREQLTQVVERWLKEHITTHDARLREHLDAARK